MVGSGCVEMLQYSHLFLTLILSLVFLKFDNLLVISIIFCMDFRVCQVVLLYS